MAEKIVLTKEERSARRLERREKQRLQNVGRAEKMHKARIEYEQKAELFVSSQESENPEKATTQYSVGCSGWFYLHWRDHFYKDVISKDWFKHYSAQFKTVELNAPFYAWPTIATVKSWIRQADPTFVYTVKVSELITHTRRFEETGTLIKDFGLIADLLGPQMGCFIFQLPPSYHYSPERLEDIISQLDHKRRNVVEFRHASWWNEAVYDAFRKTGTIFCSCSGPRLPDELIKTAGDIYVRFHGTKQWYRHDYTNEELAVWAKRIKDSGASRVWAYFNNDFGGYAITNAKELLRLLKEPG